MECQSYHTNFHQQIFLLNGKTLCRKTASSTELNRVRHKVVWSNIIRTTYLKYKCYFLHWTRQESCRCHYQYQRHFSREFFVFQAYTFTERINTGYHRRSDLPCLFLSARSCGDPGSPANGGERHGWSFQFRDSVNFTCFAGYVLVGPKTRTCLATGWSEMQPSCLREYMREI